MSPHIATSEAESPVPAESTTAQASLGWPSEGIAPAVASRLFYDASRGRWVFERGPERLNVLLFQPRQPRCEEPRPESA
jgi:hypothetical protein